ncbi:MAG TPA: sigma-70 family RNA polymerase sigma factor [Acidobacteriaceae bacterium]|jgi:RNA polymerase sigma factor (TIGR02999 family)|nr:sigma-70 family RNA polymerase sigma factor [Acidobacteriaceae bacterium]
MEPGSGEVTQLLKAMHSGDPSAAEHLLPLVYNELHRLAQAYMRRERPDHTLQATALINEAYLRLVGENIDWNSRAHFIGLAAHVMRQVLVDYARAHAAQRRAGGLHRVEMEDHLAIAPERLDEVVWLDEALHRLAAENARQAQVVELRYFGGLSVEEIAGILDLSPRSVKRDWSLARIWLHRYLRPNEPVPEESAQEGVRPGKGGGEKQGPK